MFGGRAQRREAPVTEEEEKEQGGPPQPRMDAVPFCLVALHKLRVAPRNLDKNYAGSANDEAARGRLRQADSRQVRPTLLLPFIGYEAFRIACAYQAG